MLNRTYVNENSFQFEDFAQCKTYPVGKHIEVPMSGFHTCERFVVSKRQAHPTEKGRVLLTAVAIVNQGLYQLDVVNGTVKHCGSVVAHYVPDTIVGLHYIGVNLESDAPYFCEESAEAALSAFIANSKI